MDFQTIDTTGFDNAIIAFNEARENYNAAREVIQNSTETLRGCWKGRGGEKFEDISKRILQMLKDDGDSLICIADNLARIRQRYVDVDTRIGKTIEQTEISIS